MLRDSTPIGNIGRWMWRIRTDYPNQNLKVWVGRDIQQSSDPVLDVWLGYTPLDAEQRTNRTYGYLSVKKPRIPGLIHAV